ncbi:YihY/virulence factor BrkB family protein [Streptomyces sp. JH34]|uniref:YihY/virulence factor BrkB family protein n=1 Tax=Streptomyces sp. JH34 TaxID=2793633 RepID=UPI0023F94D5C|nr:YihY/virulence factor BrkB family protein [Streptomyces sp. JH34]MDF6017023.1 YihY/virulence factor BrkB family protein [Streptomyces sp. JH34]
MRNEQNGQDGTRSVGGRSGAGPGPEVEHAAPDSPKKFGRPSWKAVLRRTLEEFKQDELTDRAAALTYYGILALFPALLVLVSLLGIAGESATQTVLDNIQKLAPGAARDVLKNAVTQLQSSSGTGWVIAIVGLLAALWSASGYVAAFIRTANAVYDVPEGRPAWKVLPVRVGLTLALMVLACVSALIVVLSGNLARRLGTALGLGDTAMTVWSIAKWPVLVVLVTILLALLYWAAPNAKGRGFKFVSLGSLLALVIWMAASAAFAFYVANFGSYNKTYGALAGVIIFLVWLWITNLAILLGLEFDAELARERAAIGGHPPLEEPYAVPRDTSKWTDHDRRGMGDTGPSDPRSH